MPKRRPNKPNKTHAVKSKNHAQAVAWKVDYDYLHKLSPSDLEWLSDFSNRHYGDVFTKEPHPDMPEWSEDERKAASNDKNRARRDIYAVKGAAGLLRNDPDPGAGTLAADPSHASEATPGYLNDIRYKTARERMRELIPPRGAKVKVTPELLKAQADVERTRMYVEAFPEETPTIPPARATERDLAEYNAEPISPRKRRKGSN